MAAGRPSIYSQELADAICEKLVNGLSLRRVCASDEFPGISTVMRWLRENEAFREQYALAREMQADGLFDEILDIADSQEGDVYVKDGEEFVNHDAIQRARLRIDARKWMAGKMRPKVYGDTIAHKHSGDNDGDPIRMVDMTDHELAHIAAAGSTRTPPAQEG